MANVLHLITSSATKLFEEIQQFQTDSDKIDYIKNKDIKFINSYPIVCKYMITENKYSSKAFYEMLAYKISLNSSITENNTELNKENFYKSQAKYAELLFSESYSNKHKLQKIYDANYREVKELYTDSLEVLKKYNDNLEKDRKKRLLQFITMNTNN